ncbi:hypothetical protein LINPERHAP1_LOCUS24641 [Linum perenne]
MFQLGMKEGVQIDSCRKMIKAFDQEEEEAHQSCASISAKSK